MIKRYLRKLLPVKLRVFLSKVEDFLLFDIYAYCVVRPSLARKLRRRQQPSEYLFVLSPARSGSSLLCNVLNSHPEITGYGESHTGYVSSVDLDKLICRTAVLLDDFDALSHKYVMDKMVRNYLLSDDILHNERVKFIFLLRDPSATYRSMVKLFSGYGSSDGVDQWISYYKERLEYFEELAIRINNSQRCLTVRYEDLLEDTDETLALLQDFLDTKAPFSDSYTAAKTAGRLKYGDNSSSIKSGKILRRKASRPVLNEGVFAVDKQDFVYRLQANCFETLKQYTQGAVRLSEAFSSFVFG
ncbi:MAG: sulfotransferase [Cyanobacteria bacterium P01_D01_bin.56]